MNIHNIFYTNSEEYLIFYTDRSLSSTINKMQPQISELVQGSRVAMPDYSSSTDYFDIISYEREGISKIKNEKLRKKTSHREKKRANHNKK